MRLTVSDSEGSFGLVTADARALLRFKRAVLSRLPGFRIWSITVLPR